MAHLILGFTNADIGQRGAVRHFRAALVASTLGPILAGPIEAWPNSPARAIPNVLYGCSVLPPR
jgi:hypothetical protein